jgi:hypothetical protein
MITWLINDKKKVVRIAPENTFFHQNQPGFWSEEHNSNQKRRSEHGLPVKEGRPTCHKHKVRQLLRITLQ